MMRCVLAMINPDNGFRVWSCMIKADRPGKQNFEQEIKQTILTCPGL